MPLSDKKISLLLFVVPLGILLILVTIIGVWFYFSQKERILFDQRETLTTIADLKKEQIVAWLSERWRDITVIATDPFFATAVAPFLSHQDRTLPPFLLHRLETIYRRYGYEDVVLADTSGEILWSAAGTSLERLGRETLLLVEKAISERRFLFSDFYRCSRHGLVHIDFIAPLFPNADPSRDPFGILILRVSPHTFLYPLVQSWPAPSETAETLLVRREGGEVLYLNELRHRKGTSLSLRIPLSRTEIAAVRAALGEEGIFEGRDYRDKQVISATRKIPGTTWSLVAKVDTAEALAGWHRQAGLILTMFMLMAIMLTTATGVLWYRRQRDFYRNTYLAEQKAQEIQQNLLGLLQEKNEELETLLYATTHDLRAPLVNIQGFTERARKALNELRHVVERPLPSEELCRLVKPIIKDELPRDFAHISASSERMDMLISALLRVARLDRSAPRREYVRMNDLIKKVCDNLSFHLQEAEAEMSVGPLPDCWGDPSELEQLFTNLLDNAVKYRDPARKLVITVTGTLLGDHITYTVSDTGIGIREGHQTQIWNLFSRLNPRGPTVGHGIGLALVQRIAKRHGGTVWVKSDPGKGSAFSVTLPIRPRASGRSEKELSEGERP